MRDTVIATEIKAIRESLGLTQAELAEKIGKTRCCIADYETGRSAISHADMLKIQGLYKRKKAA